MSDNFHGVESKRDHAPSGSPRSVRAPAQSPLTRIATAVGNRGFARTIARMRDGEGILPGGVVHPDVETAIAAARGGGQPAQLAVAGSVGAALGDSLADVRVHTDDGAASLARSVSARAFTVGSDIFFGAGEYQPATPAGRELLSHELVHVVQQRGTPRSGPLTVSQPGDALEREAEDVARGI
jgi:Domain of unknown function (DUF4157)